MNFFDRLFGRKNNDESIAIATPSQGDIPVDLFTEKDPPALVATEQTDTSTAKTTKSTRIHTRPAAITEFLEQDFWKQGHGHAMHFPSKDRRDSALRKISADYRLVLDKAAQLLQADLENHEQDTLRLKGVNDGLDAQMERRVRELERLLVSIDKQMELSVDEEGWLAPVVAAYHDGFTQGSMEYLQQQELLDGISILR